MFAALEKLKDRALDCAFNRVAVAVYHPRNDRQYAVLKLKPEELPATGVMHTRQTILSGNISTRAMIANETSEGFAVRLANNVVRNVYFA